MSNNSEKISKFSVGDEVQCNYKGCTRDIFVVARIHAANSCASRVLIVAHLKGDQNREIKGVELDGINYGIDSGWFRKVL